MNPALSSNRTRDPKGEHDDKMLFNNNKDHDRENTSQEGREPERLTTSLGRGIIVGLLSDGDDTVPDPALAVVVPGRGVHGRRVAPDGDIVPTGAMRISEISEARWKKRRENRK